MALPEKFIEGIVRNASRTMPENARPRCLFFGFSDPFQRDYLRIESQAAVVHYRIGMVATYKLYTSDTGEMSGYFGSRADITEPRTLGRAVVPGCVATEYAAVELDGAVSVYIQGQQLRPDEQYRMQLDIHLALLTLEC